HLDPELNPIGLPEARPEGLVAFPDRLSLDHDVEAAVPLRPEVVLREVKADLVGSLRERDAISSRPRALVCELPRPPARGADPAGVEPVPAPGSATFVHAVALGSALDPDGLAGRQALEEPAEVRAMLARLGELGRQVLRAPPQVAEAERGPGLQERRMPW